MNDNQLDNLLAQYAQAKATEVPDEILAKFPRQVIKALEKPVQPAPLPVVWILPALVFLAVAFLVMTSLPKKNLTTPARESSLSQAGTQETKRIFEAETSARESSPADSSPEKEMAALVEYLSNEELLELFTELEGVEFLADVHESFLNIEVDLLTNLQQTQTRMQLD